MAYDRATFKAKLRQHLTGALNEFYKAAMAKKNGHSKWVRHWTTEVRQLLWSMQSEFNHSVRGRYNLHRAYEEVKEELQDHDSSFRRRAESSLHTRYGLRGLHVHLDDNDEDEFWQQADAAAD